MTGPLAVHLGLALPLRQVVPAGYRVDLPSAIRGVNPRDDVTGGGGAPECGENEAAEAAVTFRAWCQSRRFMIVKGFIPFPGANSVAIMEVLQKTREARRGWAKMSNSRGTGNEHATPGAGWPAADQQAINRRALSTVALSHCDGSGPPGRGRRPGPEGTRTAANRAFRPVQVLRARNAANSGCPGMSPGAPGCPIATVGTGPGTGDLGSGRQSAC